MPVLLATEPKEVMLAQFQQQENSYDSLIRVLMIGWNTFVYRTPSFNRLQLLGEVTARIFGFNDSVRLHEREEMIRFGIYPGRNVPK
ncbi:MAG TPA: hypothetical protein VI306_12370 [Pyrinomonadaceae bacterium]